MSERAGRVGRPSGGAAEAIQDRLLERVWRLYVEGGYANISYDAIALAERMSKRTIYARHADKAALFRAAVARKLDRWFIDNELAVHSRFADPLSAFVELAMRVLLTPDAFAMCCIMRGEEGRFPDLAQMARAHFEAAADRLAGLLPASRGVDTHLDPTARARCILDLLMGWGIRAGGEASAAQAKAVLEDQLPTMLRICRVMAGES